MKSKQIANGSVEIGFIRLIYSVELEIAARFFVYEFISNIWSIRCFFLGNFENGFTMLQSLEVLVPISELLISLVAMDISLASEGALAAM